MAGKRATELCDALRVEMADIYMRTRRELPREGNVVALRGWIDVDGGRVGMRKVMVCGVAV